MPRTPDSSQADVPAAANGGAGARPSLAALARRAEGVDPSFRSHAGNVAALSVEIGKALGLCKRELDELEFAAAFHDVGKVEVSAEVLAKRGPLDEDEWESVRQHPVHGERLLAPWVEAPQALAIVRSHHERWDGQGYPDRLAGDAIPLGARIVAVADAFAAMIEPRPYRAPRARADARAELLAQAGRQFDPVCARLGFETTGSTLAHAASA